MQRRRGTTSLLHRIPLFSKTKGILGGGLANIYLTSIPPTFCALKLNLNDEPRSPKSLISFTYCNFEVIAFIQFEIYSSWMETAKLLAQYLKVFGKLCIHFSYSLPDLLVGMIYLWGSFLVPKDKSWCQLTNDFELHATIFPPSQKVAM